MCGRGIQWIFCFGLKIDQWQGWNTNNSSVRILSKSPNRGFLQIQFNQFCTFNKNVTQISKQMFLQPRQNQFACSKAIWFCICQASLWETCDHQIVQPELLLLSSHQANCKNIESYLCRNDNYVSRVEYIRSEIGSAQQYKHKLTLLTIALTQWRELRQFYSSVKSL